MNINKLVDKLNRTMENAIAEYDEDWNSITIETDGNQYYGDSYEIDMNDNLKEIVEKIGNYVYTYLADTNAVALDTIRGTNKYIDIDELVWEIKAWKDDLEYVYKYLYDINKIAKEEKR